MKETIKNLSNITYSNFCSLCPRNCKKRPGYCGEKNVLRVSRAALHFYEEPLISGTNGSGAVFFSGCNLKCIFCQNSNIALGNYGKEISVDRLCEIFFELKEQKANNINLVTPSHFLPLIAEAVKKAKDNNIALPFVYNSSAYEKAETLRQLDGLIDVYLPDYKYEDSRLSAAFSNAPDYPEVSRLALDEMYRQVGKFKIEHDKNNNCELIKSGVIIRHLCLPGHIKNSIACIDYLYNHFSDNVILSVMNQYTPLNNPATENYPELRRKLTGREYEKVLKHICELDITNCYIQEGDVASESFIPQFDMTGV